MGIFSLPVAGFCTLFLIHCRFLKFFFGQGTQYPILNKHEQILSQSPCQFTFCFYFLFHSIMFLFYLFLYVTKFDRRLQLSRREISAKCTCKLILHQDGVGGENLNNLVFHPFITARLIESPVHFLPTYFS